MPEDEQERSEQATPKKKEEARKKGRVARSREISSASMILGLALGMGTLGPAMIQNLQEAMRTGWTGLSRSPMSQADFSNLLLSMIWQSLIMVGPLLILFGALALVSSVAQHGLLWTAHPMVPDLSRINPIKGFKRIFSMQALMELAKTILKFIVVAYISFLIVREALPEVLMLSQMEPRQIAGTIGRLFIRLILWSGIAIAILGIGDFLFQRWDFERQLRMSRREVKEELKETEGDPLLRARIRSLQREMTRRRMMEDVPKSDVVITNPTRIAIAVQYDQATMQAPRVLAKGAGIIANRIREIARQNGIPVVENKPLARSLFKLVEVGHQIPVQLYRAVAEILAYVYRLKKRES